MCLVKDVTKRIKLNCKFLTWIYEKHGNRVPRELVRADEKLLFICITCKNAIDWLSEQVVEAVGQTIARFSSMVAVDMQFLAE